MSASRLLLVALLAGCAAKIHEAQDAPPTVAGPSIVRAQVTSRDGTPAAGTIELRAPGRAGALAVCELRPMAACRLRTEHRGFTWVDVAVAGYPPHRISTLIDGKPISVRVTPGPFEFEFSRPREPAAMVAAVAEIVAGHRRTPLDDAELEAQRTVIGMIASRIDSVPVRNAARVAAIGLLRTGPADAFVLESHAALALEQISPGDGVWSIDAGAMAQALAVAERRDLALRYATAALAHNADPEVVAPVLAWRRGVDEGPGAG